MLRFPAPSLDRHTVRRAKSGVAAHLQMGREGASKRISAVPFRTALRPSIYEAGMEMLGVHQKGHKKRAGEAGGKARFVGWQGGGPGGRPLAGARRLGGLAGPSTRPDRLGMTRKDVARASPITRCPLAECH